MRRLPVGFVAVLVVLALIAVLVSLTYLSIPPFDRLQFFIFGNIVGFFTLLTLAVIGGAFVGMLLAHRILGSREFSPFERNVLESLDDIRTRLKDLEAREPPLRR